MKQYKLLLFQDFNWHDSGKGGEYIFGEDGYLKMDGSQGRIECSRYLKKPIKDKNGAIELKLRVVLGKCYHIRFYSADNRNVLDCLIDENGYVKFKRNGEYIDSGEALTFQFGIPFSDPAKRKWYVVESDEHCFRFENFNFSKGEFTFLLDGKKKIIMAGCLNKSAGEINKIQLETCSVAVGSIIRLKEYSEYSKNILVERETFPLYWQPVPPPLKGIPDDNVCQTTMRPVAYHWLETTTKYGFVKASIPSLPKGIIQFEMKPSIAHWEHCLILEEYEGTIKGGNIQVGLLNGKMQIGVAISGKMMSVDQKIPVVNHKVYEMKIFWDKDEKVCKLWVDGVPMSCNGSYLLPLPRPPLKGIDTITLHPGICGTFPTGENIPSVLRTYWGKFKIYSFVNNLI